VDLIIYPQPNIPILGICLRHFHHVISMVMYPFPAIFHLQLLTSADSLHRLSSASSVSRSSCDASPVVDTVCATDNPARGSPSNQHQATMASSLNSGRRLEGITRPSNNGNHDSGLNKRPRVASDSSPPKHNVRPTACWRKSTQKWHSLPGLDCGWCDNLTQVMQPLANIALRTRMAIPAPPGQRHIARGRSD